MIWMIISALLLTAGEPALLTNGEISLGFDPTTGALIEVRDLKANIKVAGGTGPPVNVKVNGEWVFSDPKGKLRLSDLRREDTDEGKKLTLRLLRGNWEVETVYVIPHEGAWARRRATLRFVGEGEAKVNSIRFSLFGAAIEPLADCFYTLPPLWPPGKFKFGELSPGRTRSAGIWAGTPAAVVYNETKRIGLLVGFYTETEPFLVAAEEEEGFLNVHHTLPAFCKLGRGGEMEIGDQFILLKSGSLKEVLEGAREVYELSGFKTVERPGWAWGTSIYSLFAQGSIDSGLKDLGGFRNFARLLLPTLDRMGVGVVWFNPCWPGGYAPRDYYALDPHAGTKEELRLLCDEAHKRGIHIFLDLIPHGPPENSPAGREILEKHPDWVSRKEDGSILYWWGCLSCDYAHPGWQRYMADVVTYWMRECGVDGYRVDCAGGGPANWSPQRGLRPSQSGMFGALRMLKLVRGEMKKIDPESGILGEVGSPLFLSVCDFVYDWPFSFTVLRSFTEMPRRRWVRETLRWLEVQRLTFPRGATFGMMRMLENHDKYKSVRYYGVGPMKALFSLCAFVQGVPFLFHEQEVGFERFLGRVLNVRCEIPELARGDAFYLAAKSTTPEVMSFVRKLDEGFTVVAINFASERKGTEITVPLREIGAKAGRYKLLEAFEGQILGEVKAEETLKISLDIPPFEPRLVVARPEGIPFPAIAPRRRSRGAPEKISSAPEVEELGDGRVIIRNGHYKLLLRNGLIERLLPEGSNVALIEGMDLTEGDRKIWLGRRLKLSESADVRIKRRELDGAVEVVFEGRCPRFPDGRGMRWKAIYTCDRSPEVKLELQLTPEFSTPPVLTSLLFEIRSGMVEEWDVETVEGKIEGLFSPRYALNREFQGRRYWHPSGRLWEHRLHPLNPELPAIHLIKGEGTLTLAFKRYPENNVFVREFNSDGEKGFTFFAALLPEGEPVRFGQGRPFGVSLSLSVDKPLPSIERRVWRCGPVSVEFDGPNWKFENGDLRLVIGRSRGGNLRSLVHKGTGRALAITSNIYTDYGIYGSVRDSLGREVRVSANSFHDFEPDVILRSKGGVELSFRSYLRLSFWGWANVARPLLGYKLTYVFDRSPGVEVRCGVKPSIWRSDVRAFLAHIVRIPDARRWRAETEGGVKEGVFGERVGRLWQSKEVPLREGGSIEIEVEGGLILRFDEIRWRGRKPQNIFVHQDRSGTATVFFAFLDGLPVEVRPEWDLIGYRLEVIERHFKRSGGEGR